MERKKQSSQKEAKSKQLTPMSRLQRNLGSVIAEFIGTMILCALLLAASGYSNIALVFAIFFAPIFVVMWKISGSHFNPALTIAMWAGRQIGLLRTGAYIAAQTLGALAAYAIISSRIDAFKPEGAELAQQGGSAPEIYTQMPIEAGSQLAGFGFEILGAAIVGLAFAAVIFRVRNHLAAGVAVGGSYIIAWLIAGQGSILNPAVALSQSAFLYDADRMPDNTFAWQILTYIAGTTIGAVIGFLIFKLIQKDSYQSKA